MKIIKAGKIPEPDNHISTCPRCGCKFLYKAHECVSLSNETLRVKCPDCRHDFNDNKFEAQVRAHDFLEAECARIEKKATKTFPWWKATC